MKECNVVVDAMQLLGIRLSENGCFKTIFKDSRWTESAPMYAHPGCTIQSRISLTLGVSYPLPVVFQSGNSGQNSTIGWFRWVFCVTSHSHQLPWSRNDIALEKVRLRAQSRTVEQATAQTNQVRDQAHLVTTQRHGNDSMVQLLHNWDAASRWG